MVKGYFVPLSEAPDVADRAPFDNWCATVHLPWAITTIRAVSIDFDPVWGNLVSRQRQILELTQEVAL